MRDLVRQVFTTIVAAVIFCGVLIAQSPPQRPEKEILAEREFEEAKRIHNEASLASQSKPWETTLAAYRSSLEHFSKALVLYQELGNRKNEAFCLAWIGRMSAWAGDNGRAIEAHLQAIQVFEELNDTLEVGRQYANIALIYYSGEKDYSNAVAYYKKALAAARAAKNTDLEELTLSSLGQSYSALFDRQSAIQSWEEAVGVAERTGKISQQAFTLKLIASAYDDAGDRQKALGYYERALALYRRIDGNAARQTEAYTLRGMANIYSVFQDHRKALALDLEALGILRSLNAQTQISDSLARIASSYGLLNDPENAVKYQKEAVAVQEVYGTKKQLAEALAKLGYVYRYFVRDVAQARGPLERSLSIAREINDKAAEANALSSLGDLYSDLPNGRAKEIEYKRQALDLFLSSGEFEDAGDTLVELGVATYFDAKYPQAAEYLNMAVILYTSLQMPTKLARPLTWLGHTYAEAGNPKLATAYAKQALIGYQNLRGNIAGRDQAEQRGYLKGIEDNYRALVNLLLGQGRLKEAHQILVAFKDEQSLDVTDTPEERKQVKIALTRREQAFWEGYVSILKDAVINRKRIVAIDEAIARGEADAEMEKERARRKVEFAASWRQVLDRCTAAAADFAKDSDASDVVPDLPENTAIWKTLRDVSAATGQTTVAVYQFINQDRLDSLLVTRDEIRLVSANAASLNTRATTLRALLQSDKYDPRPTGKELYDIVFKPLEKNLPAGTETILWSLDGNLRYLPMAALFDGKQYLVERFNNVTFTRADGDRLSQDVSPRWSASAFGSTKAHAVTNRGDRIMFSELPGVAMEMNSIFKRRGGIDGDVLLDQAFTREAILERLKAKRPLVHIASHFSFRPGDDARSFLLMGDGTAFTLADMKKEKDMFAGVELLTLSACNTAAQQPDANGREVDAFFELAQRLGARSVLATLWPVADNSTPWLMREFYRLKVDRHQNKAEALRNSQLALLNGSARTSRSRVRADAGQVKIVVVDRADNKTKSRADTFVIEKKDAKPYVRDSKRPFAHPFYWSPFVLIGNWR